MGSHCVWACAYQMDPRLVSLSSGFELTCSRVLKLAASELRGDILSIGRAVNYNHWGAPKRWYGVPSAAASAFEDVFKKALPEQFERHPDLLFHLTAMLSPRTLLDHKVPVFAVLQARMGP